MTTIYADFLAGGVGLAPKRGRTDGVTVTQALRDIADDLQDLFIGPPLLTDPTTGSTQASGVGNTDWNVDVEACVVSVGGVRKEFAAQNDFDIHSGSFLTGLVNGASCIAAIVCKNVSGTVTMVAVKGTPATTGTQVAPTDAEITAAVGAANTWTKIGECLINRTGDTTVTESDDNTKRGTSGTSGTAFKTIKG